MIQGKGSVCLRLHFYPLDGLSISTGTSAQKAKRWHNPQDSIMHAHIRQNLKTYTRDKGQCFDTRFLLTPATICCIRRPTSSYATNHAKHDELLQQLSQTFLFIRFL